LDIGLFGVTPGTTRSDGKGATKIDSKSIISFQAEGDGVRPKTELIVAVVANLLPEIEFHFDAFPFAVRSGSLDNLTYATAISKVAVEPLRMVFEAGVGRRRGAVWIAMTWRCRSAPEAPKRKWMSGVLTPLPAHMLVEQTAARFSGTR
jgi:hypothetical protein